MSTLTDTAPAYRCPFCPLPFYTQVGRDDHVAYRHGEKKEG